MQGVHAVEFLKDPTTMSSGLALRFLCASPHPLNFAEYTKYKDINEVLIDLKANISPDPPASLEQLIIQVIKKN
jgi:hypothetical protein